MTKITTQRELVQEIINQTAMEQSIVYSDNHWFGGVICIKNRPKRTHKALVTAFREQVDTELALFIESIREQLDGEDIDDFDAQTLFELADVDDIHRFHEGLNRRNGLLKWSVLGLEPDTWADKVTDEDRLDNLYVFLCYKSPSMDKTGYIFNSLEWLLNQAMGGGMPRV